MAYTYPYPRPALTVDAVVFKETNAKMNVLLVQRKNEPFKDKWALPGGFVEMDETLEAAVKRELAEETGITGVELFQLHTFSALKRDPRGRTVSVVFCGMMKNDEKSSAGDDAAEVEWFEIDRLPELAFDHNEVVMMAIKKTNQ